MTEEKTRKIQTKFKAIRHLQIFTVEEGRKEEIGRVCRRYQNNLQHILTVVAFRYVERKKSYNKSEIGRTLRRRSWESKTEKQTIV